MQLLCARFQPTDAADEDEFYADADFVWDFYNEVINQQDSLYHDDDYRYVLSGFARNFLIPSGSRPKFAKPAARWRNRRSRRAAFVPFRIMRFCSS